MSTIGKTEVELSLDASRFLQTLSDTQSKLKAFQSTLGDSTDSQILSQQLGKVTNSLNELSAVTGKLKGKNLQFDINTATINQAEKQIRLLQSSIKDLADPTLIAPLNAQIEKLRDRITQLSSAGTKSFQQMNKSAAQANFTLINTGRIIQDLPYGMYGIANNIPPLIESFAALSVSANTTTGAITLLVDSLLGPVGLILAASAISALMITNSNRTAAFTKKVESASTSVKRLSSELREIRTPVALTFESRGSVQGQVAEIKGLVGLLGNVNTTYRERVRLLEELSKKDKGITEGINAQNVNLEKLQKNTDAYIQLLFKEAEIKAVISEIDKNAAVREEANTKLFELRGRQAITKARIKALGDADMTNVNDPKTKELGLLKIESKNLSDAILGYSQTIIESYAKQETFQKRINALLEQQTKIQVDNKFDQPKESKGNDIVTESEAINKLLQLKQQGAIKLLSLDKEYAEDSILQKQLAAQLELKQLEKDYNDILNKESELIYSNQAQKQAILKQLENNYQEERKKIILQADISLFPKLEENAENSGKKAVDRWVKAWKEALSKFEPPKPDGTTDLPTDTSKYANGPSQYEDAAERWMAARKILGNNLTQIQGLKLTDQSPEEQDKYITKFLERFKTLNAASEKFANSISSAVTPAVTDFFVSLASGSKNAFKAFGDLIRELIIKLGQLIVKALITKAAMTFLNPAGAAAGGTGKSLIELVVSALSKSSRGAANTGGLGNGFNLPNQLGLANFSFGRGGSINTGSLTGSANPNQQRLVAEVRGSALQFILQRADATRNRLG